MKNHKKSKNKNDSIQFIISSNTFEFLLSYKMHLALDLRRLGYIVSFAAPHSSSKKLNIPESLKKFDLIKLGNHRSGIRALISYFYHYSLFFVENRNRKYVLSHTVYCNISAVIAFLILYKLKINRKNKLFVFISGFGPSRIRNSLRFRILGRIYLFIMRYACKNKNINIVTLNKNDKNLIQDFVSSRRVILWREGGLTKNDLEFKIDSKIKNSSEKLKVGYFGRFLLEKGFNDFIEVVKLSRMLKLNCDFLLGGSEDPENASSISLSKLSKDSLLGIDIKIKPNYSEFFKEIDILIFPSYREGHPLYLFRSLAYGVVPIIYSNPGNLVDIINNFNGLEANSNSPTSIVSKLIELINNRKKLNNLKNNARNYSLLFNQVDLNRQLLEIITK